MEYYSSMTYLYQTKRLSVWQYAINSTAHGGRETILSTLIANCQILFNLLVPKNNNKKNDLHFSSWKTKQNKTVVRLFRKCYLQTDDPVTSSCFLLSSQKRAKIWTKYLIHPFCVYQSVQWIFWSPCTEVINIEWFFTQYNNTGQKYNTNVWVINRVIMTKGKLATN